MSFIAFEIEDFDNNDFEARDFDLETVEEDFGAREYTHEDDFELDDLDLPELRAWDFVLRRLDKEKIKCESQNNKKKTCRCSGKVDHIHLLKQLSEAKCKDKKTYGYSKDKIWVKNGCRGNFECYYKK